VTGRVGKPTGLSQAEPVSRLGPSGFDPSRLREIPIWMVRDMGPGWQDHGTSAYRAADAIDRLEKALLSACRALRTVGDDYPGSSCHQWCHAEADAALAIALGEEK
jgi:hypothetical protein